MEFFNKLMRVQTKHDIVQAKLKKARQTGTWQEHREEHREEVVTRETLLPLPPRLLEQLANRKEDGGYSLGGRYDSKVQTQRIGQTGCLERGGKCTSYFPRWPERTLLGR